MFPELIIFDFDGTLVDTTDIILKCHKLTSEELRLDYRSEEEWKTTIGLPLKEGYRVLFPSLSEDSLDKCAATYRRIFTEHKSEFKPQLYPGVSDTLHRLHRLGIKMSIASSRSRVSLLEFCRDNDLTDHFEMILGADDVTKAKPDPEPVLKTLESLHVPSKNVLVVGDMPVDIAMGKGAGCPTVGVTYGNSSREALSESGATFIIDSFPELRTLLQSQQTNI